MSASRQGPKRTSPNKGVGESLVKKKRMSQCDQPQTSGMQMLSPALVKEQNVWLPIVGSYFDAKTMTTFVDFCTHHVMQPISMIILSHSLVVSNPERDVFARRGIHCLPIAIQRLWWGNLHAQFSSSRGHMDAGLCSWMRMACL